MGRACCSGRAFFWSRFRTNPEELIIRAEDTTRFIGSEAPPGVIVVLIVGFKSCLHALTGLGLSPYGVHPVLAPEGFMICTLLLSGLFRLCLHLLLLLLPH